MARAVWPPLRAPWLSAPLPELCSLPFRPLVVGTERSTGVGSVFIRLMEHTKAEKLAQASPAL